MTTRQMQLTSIKTVKLCPNITSALHFLVGSGSCKDEAQQEYSTYQWNTKNRPFIVYMVHLTSRMNLCASRGSRQDYVGLVIQELSVTEIIIKMWSRTMTVNICQSHTQKIPIFLLNETSSNTNNGWIQNRVSYANHSLTYEPAKHNFSDASLIKTKIIYALSAHAIRIDQF